MILFLTSCEDNSIDISPEAVKNPYKINTVKLSEIPEIRNFINQNTNNLFYKTEDIKDGAIFDEENIMEVIDTLSFTNYSFRFVYPDTPLGTFYNLVVGKTAEGENKQPFVLKYVCDENQLDEFISNNSNFSFFNGIISIHKYTDYFESGSFNKGGAICPDNFDANGDPISCDDFDVNNGSSNVGGGGGGTSGNTDPIPTGGSTPGTSGGVTIVWSETKELTLHSPRFMKSKDKSKTEVVTSDCPDCPTTVDGGVGVNIVDQIVNNLKGRARCIYDKMVDNNNNINWILENFEDADIPSEFNLIFEMSLTLDNNTNASTIKSGSNFIIKLNSNRIPERSSLSIARTILHEGIHARLREFASRKGSNEVSFPGIYDYYRNFKNNWDHQQMADFYRGTIAIGLKQYDGALHSDQFYDDIAWEGLSEIKDANGNQDKIFTEAWKKLTLSEQTRIENVIKEEKENGDKSCEL